MKLYEVYENDDCVLSGMELPTPCVVRVEVKEDMICLIVGQRDWCWNRKTGELVNSGCVIPNLTSNYWTQKEITSFNELASKEQPEPTEHLIRAVEGRPRLCIFTSAGTLCNSPVWSSRHDCTHEPHAPDLVCHPFVGSEMGLNAEPRTGEGS